MAKRKTIDPNSKNAAESAGIFLAAIFREFSAKVETKSEAALLRAAIKVETTSKLLMRNRTDQSVDGLPPRVDTGLLRASITHRIKRNGSSIMTAEVGTNVQYASDLEYGTSRTYKHPFLHPALDKNIQIIIKLERDAIREAANAT